MYYNTLIPFKIVYVIVKFAIGQPTFQSSIYGYGEPSRAVDGNKNTAYGGGSCTHTTLEDNPWWAVDLQWSRLVGEVHLTNRDGSFGELGSFSAKSLQSFASHFYVIVSG